MTVQYEWQEIWLDSLEKLLSFAQAIGSTGKRKKTRD
jgi:hypothetical protein